MADMLPVDATLYSPGGTRPLFVSDEERAIIVHWRSVPHEGQLVITKRRNRLENCEVKVFHTRSTFMGVDNGSVKV